MIPSFLGTAIGPDSAHMTQKVSQSPSSPSMPACREVDPPLLGLLSCNCVVSH